MSTPLPDLAALTATMDHRDRMALLVAVGRADAAGDPAARALLDGLAAGPVWHRVLCAWAGYGHRSADRLRAASIDRSRVVRGAALRVAIRVLDDDGLGTLLDGLPTGRERRRVASALTGGRGDARAVDRWVRPRLAGGAAEQRGVADLLPLCSEALVRQHLRTFVEYGSLPIWSRLCTFHPGVVADVLREQVDGVDRLDPRSAWIVDQVLPALARRHPDLALALVPDLVRRGRDPQVGRWTSALQVLARLRPVATFDALEQIHADGRSPAPGAFRAVCFDRNAHRLGARRIAWLMEHAWSALPDGKAGLTWYRSLSDADRRAVVDAWLARGRGPWGAFLLRDVPPGDPRREFAFVRWVVASRSNDGHISVAPLRFLPRDLRAREARRHFTDPKLGVTPEMRLPYASLLPFVEAGELLAPFVAHPDGDVRARALAAWIDAVRQDRPSLGAALAAVAARRFEQDPVRCALLSALDGLPHTVWSADALPALGEVLGHAWDAGDLSAATAAAAERLAVRGFRHDPAWGAARIERALAVRGSVYAPGLLVNLPRATRRQLLPALERIASSWKVRERWLALAWLCGCIGRDLPHAPAVSEILVDVAREVPFAGYAGAAIALLASNDRRRFVPLAEELVAADPSAVVFSQIAAHVSTKRQSLLDRALVSPMTGRWATGRTGWIVPFTRGQACWAAAQQERYADLLGAALADPESPVPTALLCVVRLAELSYVEPARLLALLDDPRPPVREWAVRCTGRLDADVAAPVLVGCLGDDRARYAIYALRRALGEMQPDEALRTLLSAPRTKVTVAKEVVRLIGDLGTEPAYRALLAMGRETLHRDVRIALLRGLWSHLERDETWAVFEAAAAAPDWVVASRLAEIATSALSSRADARYCALLAGLLARPEPEARQHLLATALNAPLRDTDRSLFRALLGRVAAPSSVERKAALRAAIHRARDPEAGAIADALARSARSAPVLLDAVDVLRGVSWLDTRIDHIRRALAAALAGDPLQAVPVLRLWVRRDEQDLIKLLQGFARSGWLGYDAIDAAIAVIAVTLAPDRVEAALRAEADPALRRLGLAALVRASEAAHGWTAARLGALEVYRKDRSPLVAGPARLVSTPEDAA